MRRLLFLILLPIILCSCLEVYWGNPVSDIQHAVVDEELIGTWVGCTKVSEEGKTETTRAYFHFGKMDEHSMKIILQLVLNHKIGDSVTNTMHVSELDDRRFMNIRKFDPNIKPPNGYGILEYEIKEKDTLLLRQPDPNFVNNAICDGVLSGICHGILVGSESSEIREFIRNSPRDQLFPVKMKFGISEFEFCSFKRLKY